MFDLDRPLPDEIFEHSFLQRGEDGVLRLYQSLADQWMTSWLLDRRNVLVPLPWITGPRLWLAYGAWLGRMTNHVSEELAVTSLVGRQRRQVEIKKTGNFNANEEHARGVKRSAAQDVISKVVFFFLFQWDGGCCERRCQ